MIEREWVRLMRWYPREWRERNAAAMAGALMDQAEGSGRQGPTASDRFGLFLSGMRERIVAPHRSSGLSIVALSFAVAMSIVYVFTIIWSPGVEYAGTFGPFANPSVITAMLMATAFAFCVLDRAGAARAFALLGSVSAIVIWVLATSFHWLGPGLIVTVMFVGLGLLGASPVRGLARATCLFSALVLLAVALIATQVAIAGLSTVWGVVGIAVAGTALIAALALTLAGLTWRVAQTPLSS